MGLLVQGTPLTWRQALAHIPYVKKHGLIQLLNVWKRFKDRCDESFLWGDEVESLLLIVDKEKKTVKLNLRATQLLEKLCKASEEYIKKATAAAASSGGAVPRGPAYLPEFGRFMVEATPSRPYGGHTGDLRQVEANMRLRRQLLGQLLADNERMATITCFPLMGVGEFTSPGFKPPGAVAQSAYSPDEAIGEHPRFATLVRNIRLRRGKKVNIRVPLFKDSKTVACTNSYLEMEPPASDTEVKAESASAKADHHEETKKGDSHASSKDSKDGKDSKSSAAEKPAAAAAAVPLPKYSIEQKDEQEIHMDAMSFGMGMCCLQVTFQATSVNEARRLYDHLAVLAPIMLAMTASTPFLRGRIADTDVRWSTISQSVDDRTPTELGTTGESKSKDSDSKSTEGNDKPEWGCDHRLPKSRYDSISTYISQEKDFKDEYNDLDLKINQEAFETLVKGGLDERLARHFAHLWIRDPLVIYAETLEQDDTKQTDHFENIQSTNWQTVRFKPPPLSGHIGWRVEFRSMEVSITDFENAAFTTFIALVSRAILYFGLDFYIPLSKVDVNMQRAHRRNAILDQKFFFRTAHINSCVPCTAPGMFESKCDDLPSKAGGDGSSSSSGSSAGSGSSGTTTSCFDTAGSASEAKSTSGGVTYQELSMNEIMTGKGSFPGLIPLVKTYLDMIKCDEKTKAVVHRYLKLIECRASGKLMTAAAWFRQFATSHPSYKQDSVLPTDLVYDLMETCNSIASGTLEVPQLLGRDTARASLLATSDEPSSDADDNGPLLKGAAAHYSLNLPTSNTCQEFRKFLAVHLQEAVQRCSEKSPLTLERKLDQKS